MCDICCQCMVLWVATQMSLPLVWSPLVNTCLLQGLCMCSDNRLSYSLHRNHWGMFIPPQNNSGKERHLNSEHKNFLKRQLIPGQLAGQPAERFFLLLYRGRTHKHLCWANWLVCLWDHPDPTRATVLFFWCLFCSSTLTFTKVFKDLFRQSPSVLFAFRHASNLLAPYGGRPSRHSKSAKLERRKIPGAIARSEGLLGLVCISWLQSSRKRKEHQV